MSRRTAHERHIAGLLLTATVVLLGHAAPAVADIKLPAVIGDNMVLQRNMDAPLWGWAAPDEDISVAPDWLDVPVATKAEPDGKWSVKIATPDAGGPHRITITGENTLTLSNVMIGEVWICSGQSNMAWPLSATDDAERVIKAADCPQIRLFTVQPKFAATPQPDCGGRWIECGPESARRFSAVAYFFGRELHGKLDVPVGLINTSWGGTVAEAWTSASALRPLKDFDDALHTLEQERTNPGALERQQAEAMRRCWDALNQRDKGTGEHWELPQYDDASWAQIDVPGDWDADDLRDHDGVVWFRREIELPDAWDGEALTIELGPIDDMDKTWLNGKQVGAHENLGAWYTPRKYTVPASAVESGRNVIAIRVVDITGPGGMRGKPEDLRIYPTDAGPTAALSLAGPWRYRVSVKQRDLPPWPHGAALNQNWPSALYNGMISPLIPYGMRGAIWYQGESNRTRARQYRTLFPALINDWRNRWDQGDFPFYYVQIAPFVYGGDTGEAAELREAQMLTLKTANTGMAVTMDIGNPADIHPRNKVDVGRRLALWALAKTYGKADLVYSGPLYKSMRVEGDQIRLAFEHVGSGLACAGESLTHFTIAGADRQFHPAEARIDGETVIVSSEAVAEPVAVRFAWGAADQPNLCNQEGLPASSFRTDDWPRPGAE